MLHISGLFGRYIKKYKEKEIREEIIVREIEKAVGRNVKTMQYSVKGDTLFCAGSPHEKQYLFIKKHAIIEGFGIHSETRHIKDIR